MSISSVLYTHSSLVTDIDRRRRSISIMNVVCGLNAEPLICRRSAGGIVTRGGRIRSRKGTDPQQFKNQRLDC